mmetsp:Transcript_9347/g.16014  ORF Transcript_9347/g.16014 Transcript_9347/m.16014 type:complete len:256 (-) Transcript_9347:210-977(-)
MANPSPSPPPGHRFDRLIPSLNVSDKKEFIEALRELSIDKPTDDEMVDFYERGGFHLIMKHLKGPDEQARGLAAIALIESFPKGWIQKGFNEYGTSDAIKALLSSSTQEYKTAGILTIASLAGDPHLDDKLISSGLIQSLITILKGMDTQSGEVAAYALLQLGQRENIAWEIYNKGGLKPLVDLLDTGRLKNNPAGAAALSLVLRHVGSKSEIERGEKKDALKEILEEHRSKLRTYATSSLDTSALRHSPYPFAV